MKKLILFSIMGFVQFVFAQTPVFHDTKGELNVSNSGTLNYSLPIAAPQGLNGTSPSITLSYNSSNNNGVAGYGWNISGLSAISRVNSRLDLDGKILPIEGDDLAKDKMDAFSLDGQRLILKKNNYSVNGIIEFETEQFSNLKIEARTTPSLSDNVLTAFKTTSPNGSVTNYNGLLDGPYSIKNTVDALGNFIDYVYTGDYISEIKWGKNTNISLAGVDNTIKFIYKNRTRIEYSDLITTPKIADKILDRIEVYSQGRLFRKYQLTHETIMNNYERLKQVQEFNQNNEGANPVIFTYEDTPNTFTDLGQHDSQNYVEAPLSGLQLSGDFDGNGEVDFVADNNLYLNSIGQNNWSKSDFSPTFKLPKGLLASVKSLRNNGAVYENPIIAKFQKNKLDIYDKQELLYSKDFSFSTNLKEPSINNLRKEKCRSADIDKEINDRIIAGDFDRVFSADFNGDGLSELIYERKIKHQINLTEEKKQFSYGRIYDYYKCTYNVKALESEYYLINVQPEGLTTTPNLIKINNLPSSNNIYISNINGDGKDEVLIVDNNTKKFSFYNLDINNNSTSIEPKIINETFVPEFSEEKQLIWGDFNGDSREDLMIPKEEGSADWFVYQFAMEHNQKYEYKNFGLT